jgi:phosphohistidine phosphatase
MNLILIRHADAGERDAKRWPDDDLRPVSAVGRERQLTCAAAMQRMGIRFDHLISSPLLRARETAEIVAEAYGFEGEIVVSDAMGPDCTARGIAAFLGAYANGDRVALVGHEPSFSSLAAALIGRSADARIALRKSGVIGITFEGLAAPGAGELEYLLRPKLMKKRA